MKNEILQLLLGPELPYIMHASAWGQWLWDHPVWLAVVGVGFLGVCFMIGWGARRLRPPTPPTLPGTARFLTPKEVLRSPKFRGQGLMIGQLKGVTLQLDAEEDVWVVGPKGVGKSTRVIIPAVSAWPASAIVVDTSGELLESTAPRRLALGPVYVLDFLNPAGDHDNVFDGVRWNRWDEVADLQRVIGHLTYLDPSIVRSDAGTFYARLANVLHLAVALHLHHTHAPLSVGDLLRFYQQGQASKRLRELCASSYPSITSAAQSVYAAREYLSRIWQSALMSLLPWMDAKLDAVTVDSTIPIESLQSAPHPSTIYMMVAPQDLKGRHRGPVRAVLDRWCARLCDRPAPDYQQALLWVADDLSLFGTFELWRDIPANFRKYGHRVLFAGQSFGQLMDAYGPHAGGLLTNCTTWLMFRPQERDEADMIVRRLTTTTVEEAVTRMTKQGGVTVSTTVGVQSRSRDLMTADEVLRLGYPEEGWMVVCTSGERPALLRNPAWYESP